MSPRLGETVLGFLDRWQNNRAFYLLVAGAALLMLALALGGESVRDGLRYDRAAIESGQLWRLLTCHLVHLNLNHALLNLAGFLLCSWFFDDLLRARHVLIWFALSAPVVGLAFYLFEPQLGWYVGLSGILHGYFILCLLLGVPGQPLLHLVVLALVAGRLTWEQLPGYDVDYLRDWIDGRVFVNAHLYGAIVGSLLGGALLWRQWMGRRENPADS